MGATLTLDRVEGNLLIAFTAVFVGIVTERFWRIACMLVLPLFFLNTFLCVKDRAKTTSGPLRDRDQAKVGLLRGCVQIHMWKMLINNTTESFTDSTHPPNLVMAFITNNRQFFETLLVCYFPLSKFPILYQVSTANFASLLVALADLFGCSHGLRYLDPYATHVGMA